MGGVHIETCFFLRARTTLIVQAGRSSERVYSEKSTRDDTFRSYNRLGSVDTRVYTFGSKRPFLTGTAWVGFAEKQSDYKETICLPMEKYDGIWV